MPRKLPVRSSSTTKIATPSLFSSHHRDEARPTTLVSRLSQRGRPVSSSGNIPTTGSLKPPVNRVSRSHESARRTPPITSTSRRERSPPRRRSTYRSSISPQSRRASPREDRPERRRPSPQRRRYSSSSLTRPTHLSASSALPSRPHQRDSVHERPGRSSNQPHPNSPRPQRTSSSRHSGRHRSPTPPRYRPQPKKDNATANHQPVASGHGRPSRPPSQTRPDVNSHGRPGKPATSPSTHPAHGSNGILGGFPSTFATYASVKELAKHADKAKQWAEWFQNVNGAPEEIQVLSTRVSTARDTIQQIQSSLEARPDLLDDESGQMLKEQIQDAIDGTSQTLRKMTKLLSGFTNRAEQQEGTTMHRLEEFWRSYNYKNQGEDQVRDADAELQQQLTELTTLMANIYARALKKPTPPTSHPASSPSTPLKPPTPPPSTGSARQKETQKVTDNTTQTNTPNTSKTEAETIKTSKQDKSTNTEPEPTSKIFESPAASSTAESEEEDQSPAKENPKVETEATMPLPSSQRYPANLSGSREDSDLRRLSEANIDPQQKAQELLLDAAWDGDLNEVAKALRQVPVSSCDTRALTALHLASERDHMAVAMLLLDRGANVHARADGGCMPIHLAARYASAATVEMLIERGGADPNAQTSDGRTPLHYAARSAENTDEERREVIRTLRDCGADPTIKTRKGKTPRDVAQKWEYWDAAATLRRSEKKWDEKQQEKEHQKKDHQMKDHQKERRPNWFQRHFMN